MDKQEWKEKKVNLSSAIIIGAVLAILGGVIGANWNNWFSGFAPYLGLGTNKNSDWSALDEVYNKLKKIDSTRFIDATSGWFYGKESDLDSRHIYFKMPYIKKPNGRPFFLSEFGGFSLRVDRHLFGKKNYGYSIYRDKKSFTDAVYKLYTEGTAPLIKDGLCGTVYTQISDVEDETNGLITYDRRVVKIDESKMREANECLYREFDIAVNSKK